MRIKFEIAADDTPTVLDSEADAETIEVERDGDKLIVYVVAEIPLEQDIGDVYE